MAKTAFLVIILVWSFVHAIAANDVFHVGFLCYNCPRQDSLLTRAALLIQSESLQAALLAYPAGSTSFEIIDMGPVGASYEEQKVGVAYAIAKNLSFAYVSPGMYASAADIHDALPHFRAVMSYLDDKMTFPLPRWMVLSATRDDQAGFLAGYMAGLMTRSGNVATILCRVASITCSLLRTGFNNGARMSCPKCIVDGFHIGGPTSPGAVSVPRILMDRGADVIAINGGGYGRKALPIIAEYPEVLSIDLVVELRNNPTLEALKSRMPYAVLTHTEVGVAQSLRNAIANQFTGGYFLNDMANGAVTLQGCLVSKCKGITPNIENNSMAVFNALRSETLSTGVDWAKNGLPRKFSHPAMLPFRTTDLSDHFGPSGSWNAPFLVPLQNWKFLIVSDTFDETWSYLTLSHSFSNYPTPGVHAGLRDFSALSMNDFTLIFGGRFANGTSNGCVLKLSHDCSGFYEDCTELPSYTVIACNTAAGSRTNGATARIAPDAALFTGGYKGLVMQKDAWVLNTTTLDWKRISDAPHPRSHHQAISWEPFKSTFSVTNTTHERVCSRVVVFTGGVGLVVHTTDVFCIDFMEWLPSRVDPIVPSHTSSCVVSTPSFLYMFGGEPTDQTVMNSSMPSPLYAFNAVGKWEKVTIDHIADPLPNGAMRCAQFFTHAESPMNITETHVPYDSYSVFYRVYVLPVYNDRASSHNLTMVTLPRFSCDDRRFGLQPTPLGQCRLCPADRVMAGNQCAPERAGAGFPFTIVLPVVIGAILIACSAVFLSMKFNSTDIVPAGSHVALGVIEIRPTRYAIPSIRATSDFIIEELRRRGLYRSQAFGYSITVVAADPVQLLRFFLSLFEHFHVNDPNPPFSIACSLAYGEAMRIQHRSGKVLFAGDLSRVATSLAASCPLGTIHVQECTLALIDPSEFLSCYKSDHKLSTTSVDAIALFPQVTEQFRSAETTKRTAPQHEPSSKQSKSTRRRDLRDTIAHELAEMFFRELFQHLHSSRKLALFGTLCSAMRLNINVSNALQHNKRSKKGEAMITQRVAHRVLLEMNPVLVDAFEVRSSAAGGRSQSLMGSEPSSSTKVQSHPRHSNT